MMNNKQRLAFTLVELIVVIVILAILATIAFLSFSSQSGGARDSTRLSDISSIKKGMEIYNVGSGLYPAPDNPTSFTYSGGTIWNQGTLGDSAYRLIQKTLSKKVKDPLKDSEYDYSLASNKKEYQVAGNFENPTSFEKTYNPFESDFLISQFSILNSPDANALGGTGTNVYISGNYNGIVLKVFTGSTYHYIPTPTLFGINQNGTGNVVYDNTFGSGKIMLPGINNFANYKADQVYSTGSMKLSDTDILALMTKMQNAYSGSNITTPAIQKIITADTNTLVNQGEGLIKNYLGGSMTASENTITAPNGTSSGSAATSCNSIKANYPSSLDGIYWVKSNSNVVFQAYCDMETNGGWTEIIKNNTTTVSDLSNFGNTSYIASTFYSDSTYGVGWGTNDQHYKSLILDKINFESMKITYTGRYDGTCLGYMSITTLNGMNGYYWNEALPNQGENLLSLSDGNTTDTLGQSFSIGGTTIFTQTQTNILNRTDTINGYGKFINMTGYTSGYCYNKRYINKLYVK